MTIRVQTEFSVYELDEANSRIRQTAGFHTTERFWPQGEWRTFEEVIITDRSMTVVWERHPQMKRYTRTSRVVDIGPLRPRTEGL